MDDDGVPGTSFALDAGLVAGWRSRRFGEGSPNCGSFDFLAAQLVLVRASWKGLWEIYLVTYAIAEQGVVLLIQLLAVISVAVARIRFRSSVGLGFQVVFFIALTIVGAAAMASVAMGGASWMAAAVTLPLMAVGATLDLKDRPTRTF